LGGAAIYVAAKIIKSIGGSYNNNCNRNPNISVHKHVVILHLF